MAQAEIYELPPHACEISMTAVAAARFDRRKGAVEAVECRRLAEGCVTPSLQETNLARPAAVAEALAAAMQSVAGGGREVAAVVPDAAARVLLLEFDTLPERSEEAEPLIRFRLKKALPFDLDEAVLSYQSFRGGKGVGVLAVIMLRTVRDEYEAVIRQAGCVPGVLVPSTLAALGMIDTEAVTLFLKLDDATTSVAVTGGGRLLLFRTHEGGSGLNAHQIAEDVHPSLVYLQDTHAVQPERIVLSGAGDASELAALLREESGARVEVLGGEAGSDTVPPEAAGCVGVLLG
jgi:type IV pilus assembly protein PilM